MAARKMLELKGIDYKRRDLMPVIARPLLKAMRFPGVTIPALRINGERINGSREIAEALDRIEPNPPLFPADPAARVAVEDAEEWGREILQKGVRRILWNAVTRDKKPLLSYTQDAKLGVPPRLAVAT